jgi:hypothetical protein
MVRLTLRRMSLRVGGIEITIPLVDLTRGSGTFVHYNREAGRPVAYADPALQAQPDWIDFVIRRDPGDTVLYVDISGEGDYQAELEYVLGASLRTTLIEFHGRTSPGDKESMDLDVSVAQAICCRLHDKSVPAQLERRDR